MTSRNMPFYRKLVIILSNSLFKLLLFFTISIVAAVFLYTDRSYIPSVLERNDVYNRVVGALLETNKEQSLTVGGDVTLDDSEVKQIINEAFPAEDLKSYSVGVINSAYSWLEQDVSSFRFTIDLTENKARLANGLSLFAINRLEQLPTCTETPEALDPFSATCVPANVNLTEEQEKIESQLLSESGFLDEAIITEKSIIGDESSAFEDRYRYVPTYYSIAKFVPVYISLILFALALIVIFASSTRKIGIRKIGRGLIGAGASLIFFTVLFSFVLPTFTGTLPIFQSNGLGIDALLNEVAIDFGRDYSWMIIKISAPLILVGAIMVVYAQASKNKKDYKSVKLKSGIVNSNEQKSIKNSKSRSKPPIQSSESSDTKPKRKLKNNKYRKIPKKEI